MKIFYIHNLMQSPMVCEHLRGYAIRHEYTLPLGPQNATDPPTAPIEIAKSNPSNVHLQTNAPSLPQSLQPITSHTSGDHEIPTRSTFSDIGNDCPCSSNRSPPLPNSPPTGRMHFHISISMDYVMFFSCVGLVAVSYLAVFFN